MIISVIACPNGMGHFYRLLDISKVIAKKNIIDQNFIKDMSASFQKCVGDILSLKLKRVISELYKNNTEDLSQVQNDMDDDIPF